MTEGNWNMSDGKTAWVNYLEADLNVALWKGAQFEGAAIATYAAGSWLKTVCWDIQIFIPMRISRFV